jgi:small membrane protein
MLKIQVLLILSVGVVALFLLRAAAGARHQAIRRVLAFAFVIAAVLSILTPTWVTRVAHLVGVGRGTDLLLYGLIVTFLGYTATSYRRFRLIERRLTELTRQIALDEVPPPGQVPGQVSAER